MSTHLRDLNEVQRGTAWRTVRNKSIDNPRAIELREQAVEIIAESVAHATPEQLAEIAEANHDMSRRIPTPPAPPQTAAEDDIERLNASVGPDTPPDVLRAIAARVIELRRRNRLQPGVTVT